MLALIVMVPHRRNCGAGSGAGEAAASILRVVGAVDRDAGVAGS